MKRFFAVISAFLTVGAPAVADPIKGNVVDVFGGAVSAAPTAPAVIDMRSYCHAGIDVILTRTFAGEVLFKGTSEDPASASSRWIPETVPGQSVERDGTSAGVPFASTGSSSADAIVVRHLRFDVDHLSLRIRLTSVHSGQGGGTIRATITPLPC
jgi:hypothetical protein